MTQRARSSRSRSAFRKGTTRPVRPVEGLTGEERLALLSRAVEQTSEGIAVSDLEGNLLFANRAFAEVHGYTADELTGEHLSILHSPEQMPDVDTANRRLQEEGMFRGEVWHIHRDGTPFPTLMFNTLLRDDEGKPVGMIATLRDITEQKLAEDALREAEHEKATILENINEHVIYQDLGMRIVWANKAAGDSVGLTPAELVGKRCYEIWHGRDSVCPKCPVEAAIKTGEAQQQEMTSPDGRSWFISGNPVRDGEGRVIGAVEVTQEITERKRAEEELRASERKYRDLYNGMRDACAAVDMNGRITDCNASFRRMLCYDEQEITELTYEDITPPRWHPIEAAILKTQVLRAGYSQIYEKEYIRKDGTVFPVELRTHLATNEDGTPTGMWATIRDISERKLAEEALVESEERYRTAIEHSNDGVAIVSEDAFLFVNQRLVEIFGYDDREEVIGEPIAVVIHPDDRSRVSDMSTRRQRGEPVPTRYEFKGMKKDGTTIFVEVSAAKTVFRGETVSLSFLRDVTDRRRTEEALRASEDQYRMVVENSMEAIVVVQGGRIRFSNPRTVEITGYDEIQLKDKPFVEFIHPQDREMVTETHRRRIAGEDVAPVYSFRILDRKGEVKWTEISAVTINWHGKPATLSFLTDITERKRLEEQLRHSQKMEAVGRLAGGVAHDFNNLLTAITGYGSLLMEQLDEKSPMRKDVQEIIKAGERATALTQQLLFFSRRHVAQPRVLDLNSIVSSMEKLLLRTIGEDIKLTTELSPDLERIKADQANMGQVVMNLAVNARDALPEGGRLVIRTENAEVDERISLSNPEAKPGRFVRLCVEDTGPGMERDIVDHIFEPFFTTKEAGTGLGLSVVYGIVRQHEGWIDVQSSPGRGSAFSVYLPVFTLAAETEKLDSAETVTTRGKGERILLVEDEESVRRFVRRVLTDGGYEVTEAASAAEAIRIFKGEGPFQLVFSDVVLPDRSGLRMVDELQAIDSRLKVLLGSGYTDKKSQWREIRDKGYHFQQKPYKATAILESVSKTLQD